MTVYGIHRGSVHEGGGMGYNVYTSKERVRVICELLINNEQILDVDVYGEEIGNKECPIHRWKEVSDGRWTNGVEEIKIQELELVLDKSANELFKNDSSGGTFVID